MANNYPVTRSNNWCQKNVKFTIAARCKAPPIFTLAIICKTEKVAKNKFFKTHQSLFCFFMNNINIRTLQILKLQFLIMTPQLLLLTFKMAALSKGHKIFNIAILFQIKFYNKQYHNTRHKIIRCKMNATAICYFYLNYEYKYSALFFLRY